MRFRVAAESGSGSRLGMSGLRLKLHSVAHVVVACGAEDWVRRGVPACLAAQWVCQCLRSSRALRAQVAQPHRSSRLWLLRGELVLEPRSGLCEHASPYAVFFAEESDQGGLQCANGTVQVFAVTPQ